MIFALSDASGICVATLPHLSSLSDVAAHAITGGERESYAHKEIKSLGKKGRKKATDWEKTHIDTEENGVI